MQKSIAISLLSVLLIACGSPDKDQTSVEADQSEAKVDLPVADAPSPTKSSNRAAAASYDSSRLDQLVPDLIEQERVAGIGIGILRNGATVWTGYYGEAGPDKPITEDSLFNTASVAKTITAEVMLALLAEGLIDLDEPVAPHVQHPELSSDSRYEQLTPRLLMSHRAGLLNWSYAYPDGRLAFDHDPDTRFSYSGAGIELAARYAEAKTGKELSKLAFDYLFELEGLTEIFLGVIPKDRADQINVPMNADGEFSTIEETNPSLFFGRGNSAADDLLTTVPAYAYFLESLIASEWLSDEQKALRSDVITTQAGDPIYNCPELEGLTCPDAYGHGIGWQVAQYGDHSVVYHSGSDAGETAFVHFSPDTGNGAVIFVNGANGWVPMVRILEAIGDEPLLADYYRALFGTILGRDLPPLELD